MNSNTVSWDFWSRDLPKERKRLRVGNGLEINTIFEPTVLVKTNSTMKVIQEEIFGPVVCAEPFTNVEDVIAKA